MVTALVASGVSFIPQSATAYPTPPTSVYGPHIASQRFVASAGQSTITAPSTAIGLMVKAWAAGGSSEWLGPQQAGAGGYTWGVVDTSPAQQWRVIAGLAASPRFDDNPTPQGPWAATSFGGQTVHDGGGGLSGLFTGSSAVTNTNTARAVIVAGGGGGADWAMDAVKENHSSGGNGNSPTAGAPGIADPGTLAYGSMSAAGQMQGSVDQTTVAPGACGNLPRNWQSSGGGGYQGGGRFDFNSTAADGDNCGNASAGSGRGGSGFLTGSALEGAIEFTADGTLTPPATSDPDYSAGSGVPTGQGATPANPDCGDNEECPGGPGYVVYYWLVIEAVDDTSTVPSAATSTIDALDNDGYPTGVVTSVVSQSSPDLNASVVGGQLQVTPSSSLSNTTQTVVYQICNSTLSVCDTATVTITIGGSAAPTVTTHPATSVDTGGNATLNGAAFPNGYAAATSFEYSVTPSLTSGVTTVSSDQGTLSGSAGVTSISRSLQGLIPGTTYYFRAVINNGNGGNIYGEILSFTIPKTDAPTIAAGAVSGSFPAATVTLTGTTPKKKQRVLICRTPTRHGAGTVVGTRVSVDFRWRAKDIKLGPYRKAFFYAVVNGQVSNIIRVPRNHRAVKAAPAAPLASAQLRGDIRTCPRPL